MPLPTHVVNRINQCKENYIGLESSGISYSDIEDLCELLNISPHIDSLSLAGNGIGDRGCSKLARLLPTNVTYLDLSKTNVTNNGVSELLNNKNLAMLVLESNKGITDEIANSVEKADHLLFINLLFVSLSEAAIHCIKAKVDSNALQKSPLAANHTNFIYTEPRDQRREETMDYSPKFFEHSPKSNIGQVVPKEQSSQSSVICLAKTIASGPQ